MKYTIAGCHQVISETCRQQLAAQGFVITPDTSNWLTLVDLSQASPQQVATQLQQLSSRNKVALLAPEQTELASAAMQAGAQDYLLLPIDEIQLLNMVNRL
ncbi:hypothetical protein NFHSH190041_01860 [Shewanella sp. NFH-SH190041]|uniref:hypothetical protein n=1 Tax=Shewanella sp. NFH-SH190041 TaxID=2950245 RepID=UPI002201A24E|nr:hypothetical protein NFHSH190041_01860 [Shewanella sp. NFH-SH190041]